jgi:hypothetical protein
MTKSPMDKMTFPGINHGVGAQGAQQSKPDPRDPRNWPAIPPQHHPSVNPGPPYTYLNVSDIERLAKAGVQINVGTVVPQQDQFNVLSRGNDDRNVTELDSLTTIGNTLSKAIWYRWLRARRALRDPDFGDMLQIRPFSLMANQYGDTVHVSVHPTNENRPPFELTDDAIIFPSDALMAKIALWEKDNP